MKSFNRLFVVWFVVVTLIFAGLIYLGFTYKSKIKTYEKFEDVLISGAESYINNNGVYPEKNETLKINIKDIIKSGVINKRDIVDGCTGNIIVSMKKNLTYKPDIKCKYYKSSKN